MYTILLKMNKHSLLLRNKLSILFLGIILFSHTFILTRLIFFPYPELFIYPYLTNHGLKPYQQILDQHFPGLMFLPINLNNLGMTTPEVARIWLIATVIITQLLLFSIAWQIFKSDKKALFASILYLIWQPFFEGWVFWIDSFLPLFLLPAFYFLYRGKREDWGDKAIILAGVFLGLSVVFKQVLIPLCFLVLVYILWQSKKIKTTLLFLLGLTIPVGGMLIYLTSEGVIKDFWYWTVVFNLTVYREYGRGVAPTLAHFTRVALVFGTAFFILLKIKERQSQILGIFIIGTLFGLSTRFDFVHFQPALPFAILATVYTLGRLEWWWRLGVLGYILVAVWWLIIFYKGHLNNKVFFFDDTTKTIALKIQLYTKPGEKIFIFGSVPHLYQMSNRLPAGDIFVFQFPWFLKVAEERVLEGIKRDNPEIVVADFTVEIEGQKLMHFAKEINQYILKNYHPFDQVGSTTILRRKSS